MRASRWPLVCLSVLIATVLLSLLVLLPKGSPVQAQASLLPDTNAPAPALAESPKETFQSSSSVKPPVQRTGLASTVVLAPTDITTVIFDFNDGTQGWEGLPGRVGCEPAQWNSEAGEWRAVSCGGGWATWRGSIRLGVPYDVETLKFYFRQWSCGAPQGSSWNVQINGVTVASQSWAGTGTKTVDLSSHQAPYYLTIYIASGCNGGVAVDDVQLINTAGFPLDQSWAPNECPVGNTSHTSGWTGGPISTRSGNYNYSKQDLSVSAMGGALRFEHTYNSQAATLYTDTLGYGWTHNYDMDLTLPDDPGGEDGRIIVKGCRGSRFRHGSFEATEQLDKFMSRAPVCTPICGL